MKLSFVNVSVLVFCIASCSSNTVIRPVSFEGEGEAKVIQIGEPIEVGRPLEICKEGEFLFVLAYTPDCWLHSYNKETGEMVSESIKVGRGPGEGINLISMDYFEEEQKLFVFDKELRKTLVYHLDGNTGLATFLKEIHHPLNGIINNCHHLGEGKYLYEGYLPGGDKSIRFTLSDGMKAINTYSEYPEVDREYGMMAYQLASTKGYPKKDMVVSTTFYGAVLECFHASDDHIEQTAVRIIDKPEIDTSLPYLDIKAGHEYGFRMPCLTKDYIYAARLDINATSCKDIYAFDWSGHEKIKYTADRSIILMCAGDNPDELFGISITMEGECALVKIHLE
jgi:hypothetical protein